MKIRLPLLLTVTLLTACSNPQTVTPFQVIAATPADPRAVNNLLQKETLFRRLERRVDLIRTQQITVDPFAYELAEEYTALPDPEPSVPRMIREYNATLGLEQNRPTHAWFRYEVAYELPDLATTLYIWNVLGRIGVSDKRMTAQYPHRIHVGTYASGKNATKRKAYLKHLLDIDLTTIRQVNIRR